MSEAADPFARCLPVAEDFLQPLDLIHSEHERQRLICDGLQRLADEQSLGLGSAEAVSILTFLTEDLPLHIADEEKDLFPMLKRRCEPGDYIDDILARLHAEHDLDEDLANFIVSDVAVIAKGMQLPHPLHMFLNVRAFAEVQRRHIAWENEAVLPLAGRRLTEADLVELGRNMAARRSIAYPG